MSIEAVVVTYNSADVLERLLSSLDASGCVSRTVIVDNASSDSTVDVVMRANLGHTVSLVREDTNWGFGAGVNRGFADVTADLCLVVNPDVVFSTDVLPSLVQALETQPDVAAVTPMLRRSEGLPVPTARYVPSRIDIAARRVKDVAPRNGGLVHAGWICGAFMLWRSAQFRLLDGFDPGYFLFYEDVDICQRAAALGWKVALDGRVWAIHDVGHSHGGSRHAQRTNRRSRARYARKYLGLTGWAAAQVATLQEVTVGPWRAVR